MVAKIKQYNNVCEEESKKEEGKLVATTEIFPNPGNDFDIETFMAEVNSADNKFGNPAGEFVVNPESVDGTKSYSRRQKKIIHDFVDFIEQREYHNDE